MFAVGILKQNVEFNKLVWSIGKRFLNLQEYQSKQLMLEHQIDVQRFKVISSPDEVDQLFSSNFKFNEYVIKAQILAGGRGKGVFSNGFKGGVKLTKDPKEVAAFAKNMLGHRLVTKQTVSEGVLVKKVMVAEALDIVHETYVAILMDRNANGPVIVASPFGGMDIEEVAKTKPDSIFKEPIDIIKGLTLSQAESISEKLGFSRSKNKDQFLKSTDQLLKLYSLFCKKDCTLVEVNPFGLTPQGRVVCFDAKLQFDDNASFRQKALFSSDDSAAETDPREIEANKHNLNYIGLDGNIGCLVNGAGLAMATMDMVQLFGGSPANFLDVGGTVQEHQVIAAFELLSKDPRVRCILVNIFGGIVNCETIARGLLSACKFLEQKSIKLPPLVVRLEGTNVQSAKKMIHQAELGTAIKLTTADNLADAAEKAVSCTRS